MKKDKIDLFVPVIADPSPVGEPAPKEFFKYLYSYLKDADIKEVADSAPTVEHHSQQAQIAKLSEYYQRERLVLVFGAGVSIEHGLPDWNTLLQKLLLSTIAKDTHVTPDKSMILAKAYTALFLPNPLIAARYLYNFYKQAYAHDQLAFEKAIRQSIYEELNLTKDSALMKEIQKFCIAAGKSPNLDCIITYNYDDLVERYLTEIGVDLPFRSIYAAGMNPLQDELPIYHVHGYLPPDGELTEKNRVTLSEDFYHQQYSDVYGWSNLVQINKFKDFNCIFVGMSFSDPNFRRLLDIARMQRGDTDIHHYHFRKHYDAKAIEEQLKTYLDEHKDVLDEKERAKLKLSDAVKYLVQISERFEENDALSFGVGTIWVKEYPDIPKLLSKIRKVKNETTDDQRS